MMVQSARAYIYGIYIYIYVCGPYIQIDMKTIHYPQVLR